MVVETEADSVVAGVETVSDYSSLSPQGKVGFASCSSGSGSCR